MQDNEIEVVSEVATQGNRSDVRALALSEDDSLLLTTGNGGSKLWSTHTGKCLNSVATGYGLCALFAPGDKYAVVGCKDGLCDVVDVGLAAVIERLPAHTSQVRTFSDLQRHCTVAKIGPYPSTTKVWQITPA